MVSFKITYFRKSLACSGCFGLFTKIKINDYEKKIMGVVFTADSLHTFSINIFLIKYPVE